MGEYDTKLAELEQRAKSNTRRIDKLEQTTDALTELTLAVREMVVKQDHVAKAVDRLDAKVEALESKPGKRWDSVVDKAVLAVVGGIVGYFLSAVGGV